MNLSLDRNVITDKVLGQRSNTNLYVYPNLHRRRSPHSTTCLFKEPMAQRNEEAIKLLEEAGYNKPNPVEIHHSLQY